MAWQTFQTHGNQPVDVQNIGVGTTYAFNNASEHSPGQAIVDTFQMTRSAAAVGIVFDSAGQPVAGITVLCEFKHVRYSETRKMLTDRNGKFRFVGVGLGTPVQSSVLDLRGVTDEPLQVTLTSDANPMAPMAKRLKALASSLSSGESPSQRERPMIPEN